MSYNHAQYTYIEHSKLSSSMVWRSARLLRQIRHQISLGPVLDRHVECFYRVLLVMEERSEEKRYQTLLVRQVSYCRISVIVMCNLLNNECWIKGLVNREYCRRGSVPEPGVWHLQTADCRLQTADWRLQTGDRRLQTADCRLQTADCRLQTADCRLQTADCRLQTADCRLQTADCRLQTADCRLQTADYRIQNTDCRL